jgi:hypothetical protein
MILEVFKHQKFGEKKKVQIARFLYLVFSA